MINSILNQYTDTVHLQNIKTSDSIITDPTKIKQHVSDHYNEWTAHHPFDEDTFNHNWKTIYQPNSNINSEWYTSILQEITIQEIINTIQQLPNNKACGPTGISYEMIKHLGSNMLSALTALFNRCLNTQSIPKQ
jgi:hemerythrin superfamily protein